MRKVSMVTVSLALGGALLLAAGCSFQFQAKPGVKASAKVAEEPKPEEVKTAEKVVEEQEPAVEETTEVKEEELAATHTVVKGETLWDIAGYDNIYGDPTKWKLIYKANRDILDSPDALKPGQVLVIPRE